MIDFTNCKEYLNKFKGSEKKMTIEYNGKIYLLKFPDPIRERDREISYINNAVSEYLGCKIYQSIGLDTQNVILGVYRTRAGKEKVVCACEDFTSDRVQLYEYKNFLLSDIDKETPNDVELEDVIESIQNDPRIKDVDGLKERFWDMFVVDSFIGNGDRHTGNWGLLGDGEKIISLAPVFDCGSCLFPLLGDSELSKLPRSEYKNKAINIYSCYRTSGKRIHACKYILSMENPDCNAAVKRIVPKIDMENIKSLIMGTSLISDVKKNFYTEILSIRYEEVLNRTMKRLMDREQIKTQTTHRTRPYKR